MVEGSGIDGGRVMSKKPETVGKVTEEEIAEGLDGFAEEMLASIRRGKEMANKPKAKVLEFPSKLLEQQPLRRQQIIDQDRERLEARINEQRREQGLPSLKMARQARESLEFVGREPGKVVSEYN